MNTAPINFETLSSEKNESEFNFNQITWLYEFETDIPYDYIKEILNLPREPLIKDLEKVLRDAVYKFRYYESEEYKGKTWFVLHALFLLKELKAEESLNSILIFLQNDRGVLDFWMGDLLTEELWAVVANCSVDKLDTLKAFMFIGGICESSKITIGEAVTQLALNKIIEKDIAVKWHSDVMQYYLNYKDDPICDPDINGSLVCNCLDLCAIKLKPLIKKMFDEEIVTRGWAGDWEEVDSEFKRTNQPLHTNKIEPIENIYKKWNEIFNTHSIFEKRHQTFLNDNFNIDLQVNKPFVRELPKVSRNELCPCGSGKKYKKCHGIE